MFPHHYNTNTHKYNFRETTGIKHIGPITWTQSGENTYKDYFFTVRACTREHALTWKFLMKKANGINSVW
jgi:hypothetical protein